jgi:hypothetical protein
MVLVPTGAHGKQTEVSYPTILSFASAVRRYTELTRRDHLVRRDVAVVMNGLLQSLELVRKRVPGEILYKADRLESFFFAGYDPHFEGDEPPGL